MAGARRIMFQRVTKAPLPGGRVGVAAAREVFRRTGTADPNCPYVCSREKGSAKIYAVGRWYKFSRVILP